MEPNKNKNGQPAVKPLKKDFAHYPATEKKQVGLDAEPDKNKDDKNICYNKGAGQNSATTPGTLTGTNTKVVNGSNKIVNEDEPYSNGSGGAFEATEMVNE